EEPRVDGPGRRRAGDRIEWVSEVHGVAAPVLDGYSRSDRAQNKIIVAIAAATAAHANTAANVWAATSPPIALPTMRPPPITSIVYRPWVVCRISSVVCLSRITRAATIWTRIAMPW